MYIIALALVLLAIVGGMIAEHKKHKKGNWQMKKLWHNTRMKRILELITEIENWNDGDKETFNRFGEVPFDGVFVFNARQVRLTELRNELKKLLKKVWQFKSLVASYNHENEIHTQGAESNPQFPKIQNSRQLACAQTGNRLNHHAQFTRKKLAVQNSIRHN